jgi:hypothetical protein
VGFRTTLFESSATSAIPTRTTTARTPEGNSGAVEVVTNADVDVVLLVVLVVVVVVVLELLVVEDVAVVEVALGE